MQKWKSRKRVSNVFSRYISWRCWFCFEVQRMSLGYYTAESGQPFCMSCDAGTYADKFGLKMCNQCPSGFYQPEKRSNACEKCPLGTSNPNNASAQCHSCNTGQFAEGIVCMSTLPKWVLSKQKEETDCIMCDIGKYVCHGTHHMHHMYESIHNFTTWFQFRRWLCVQQRLLLQ